MGFIYRIQNKVTGKSYIGQTSVKIAIVFISEERLNCIEKNLLNFN